MGSAARIVLYAKDEESARNSASRAFETMEELDARLSHWRESSELVGISKPPPRTRVGVSAELFGLLQRSLALSEATDGAFDVTVGPLVQLWRQARDAGQLPEAGALAEAQRRVGSDKLELDPAHRTVALTAADMALDLGAIGKGFACDAALATLAELGIEHALVELGGDVVASAPPPGRDAWQVSRHCGHEGHPVERLPLARGAIATSGDSERFAEIDGVRYSHIVDPRTGFGLTGGLCASVRAADATTADALASAVCVLGAREGRATARALGAEAWTCAPRFVSLFDGETLEGWVTRGGRYDGNANWTVEDGAITGRVGPNNAGGLLYTEKAYREFELSIEVAVDYPFDSGLFFRMAPEGKGAQITIDFNDSGQVGAIYSDGFLAQNHEGKARFRKDAWNHFLVRCTGSDLRLEAWMNGEPLVDFALPDDTPGYAPTGLIGVQVHGSRNDPPENAARFRRVWIREL